MICPMCARFYVSRTPTESSIYGDFMALYGFFVGFRGAGMGLPWHGYELS